MEKFDFSSIPTIGWISFIILGILCSTVIILAIVLICNVLKNKNIKSKFIELNEPIREEIKER
ncbi:MAG: hypothetical protein J6T31_06840, partial [Methanobrevibacter sp.]|nr:hypothetical protein [Methanobrevibacter sp.]